VVSGTWSLCGCREERRGHQMVVAGKVMIYGCNSSYLPCLRNVLVAPTPFMDDRPGS
jgi:hypothetical protein